MAGAAQRFVAYERVSTKRQGASGLGLEAQRKAIDDLAASRAAEDIARFTEVESGKLADRPELAKALHLAKVTGATLLIAKPAVAKRRVPADAPGQRRPVRRRRHAGGERPHRRDDGAGGGTGARGDLPAHQGGAGRRQGTRGEAG